MRKIPRSVCVGLMLMAVVLLLTVPVSAQVERATVKINGMI